MDQRDTFKDYQQLFSIFLNLQQQKQKASLLIDNNGLTRIEGEITDVVTDSEITKSLIIVDNKDSIPLEKIIAVNGLFCADYSEC